MKLAFILNILVSLVGFGLFVCGIGYAVLTGVAIPDQDPTPEMQAQAHAEMQIVDLLMIAGGGIFLLSLLSFGVLLIIWLIRRVQKKRPDPAPVP